jgi:hypothetical protein
MGKSKSIEDLSKKNEEFQKYINGLTDQLQKKSSDAQENMNKEIEQFYKENNYTKEEYISGRNSDFMQKYEWSLTNVNKIILGIQKAMFGESAPPQGTTIAQNTTTELSESIKAMTDLKTYILGQSFKIITGAIESLGNSNEIHYGTQYKHETLGNGFHLFATVVSDSFQSSSFFEKESICEYLYIYRVCFSVEEAQAQAKMGIIKLYEDQIAVFIKKLENLLDKYSNELISIEQYTACKSGIQSAMEEAQNKLSELNTKKLNSERVAKLEAKEQKLKALNPNLFV